MKRRTPPDEPDLWPNTRTDAETYAETALGDLLAALGDLSEREQGSIRDALAEAFLAGEHQGECRGVRVLAIAQSNARMYGDGERQIAVAIELLVGE